MLRAGAGRISTNIDAYKRLLADVCATKLNCVVGSWCILQLFLILASVAVVYSHSRNDTAAFDTRSLGSQGFAYNSTTGDTTEGGGSRGSGNLVKGVLSQYREQVATQKYNARAQWVRARRLLNRLLNTNEFLTVGPAYTPPPPPRPARVCRPAM